MGISYLSQNRLQRSGILTTAVHVNLRLEQIQEWCGRKNGGCDILSPKITFDGAAESRTSQRIDCNRLQSTAIDKSFASLSRLGWDVSLHL